MYSFLFLFLFSCVLPEEKTQGYYCWYWEKQSFGYDLCFHSLRNPPAHWLQWCRMQRRYLSITQRFKSIEPRSFAHTNFNIALHFLFGRENMNIEICRSTKVKKRKREGEIQFSKANTAVGLTCSIYFSFYEHVRI